MRFLFFVFGVPMMIMSFLQVSDAIPFVQDVSLTHNGSEIVLTQAQTADLKTQVEALFEGSHTMPALAVVFGDDFAQMHADGTYISLKFQAPVEINDLPFDELIFKVSPEAYGFNLFRGNNGVVQGRCIYVDLNGKTMQEFSEYVSSLIESAQQAGKEATEINQSKNS